MTLDKDDLINSIMASIDRIKSIKIDELPNIDLYMDQVTTFMDERLRSSSRNPGEDKILTKTMINNYAKNDLLPPPVKKKYSKEHIVALIFIYYSKGFLSIQDIQALLGPMTERYFEGKNGIDLCSIYDEVFNIEDERIDEIKDDIQKQYARALETFENAEGEDKDILQLYSFVFMLSYDVYVKKLLIEKLLDNYSTSSEKSDTKDKKKKKNQ